MCLFRRERQKLFYKISIGPFFCWHDERCLKVVGHLGVGCVGLYIDILRMHVFNAKPGVGHMGVDYVP